MTMDETMTGRSIPEPTMARTERGFAIARFADADGAACSLQDSSLATEPCVWLGRERDAGCANGRMHLTQTLVSGRILPWLREFAEARAVPPAGGAEASETFEDRYGQQCVLSLQEGTAHLGVTLDLDGRRGEAMRLGRETAASLLPALERFAATGSITDDGSEDDG